MMILFVDSEFIWSLLIHQNIDGRSGVRDPEAKFSTGAEFIVLGKWKRISYYSKVVITAHKYDMTLRRHQLICCSHVHCSTSALNRQTTIQVIDTTLLMVSDELVSDNGDWQQSFTVYETASNDV